MSSAATRAEARRKAILSRGGDRLARLTTSARGEDAPAYLHNDIPAKASAAFVGEETSMPPPPMKETPRQPSHSPPPAAFPPTDPSVWSEEQQRQFMQAIMSGALNPSVAPSVPGSVPTPLPPSAPAADDPLASMMAQMMRASPAPGGAFGKMPEPPAPSKQRTLLQKWLPLLHLVCMWCLLAFFVLWKEPEVFVEKTAGAIEMSFWKRWPKLATQGTLKGAWGVQVVPFFWAFITLQVMLHSLRIFSGQDEVQPPALLSLALPHLPLPLSSWVMNGLRYLHIGSAFMGDVAAIVFGIGVIVLVTTWFAD